MSQGAALDEIEALLRREGRSDLVAALRGVADAGGASPYGHAVAEVTRALLQNEDTYHLVFQHEHDPMSLIDLETGRFLEVNEAWTRTYGYTREEALALRVTAVSAEPAETERHCGSMPAGSVARVDVRWHRSKDGAVFPVELTSGKLSLGGRQVAYAVMREVRSRPSAGVRLEQFQARFRDLIERMPDGVVVHSLGPILYMNRAARAMCGYAENDRVEGLAAIELVHPDVREAALARMQDILRTGEASPPMEERLVRKDGSVVVAEVAAISTLFDGERVVIAIARDVSARKEVEAQLVLNDRLAALGRLAASVGHELNNPLGYVLGNLELLRRELGRATSLDPSVAERLDQHVTMIQEGALRMRDIVGDLRTLGRADVEPVGPIELQRILDVCVKMAEREVTRRARLVRDVDGRTFVVGSEARLGQVFLNLLLNAAQAIPDGDPEHNEVRVTVREEAGTATVEITDTGAGIAPENRERLFEPFFTTKGEGTGLGLSICHRLVSAAGGTLTAHANEGRGSVFRVVLPTAAGEDPEP